MHRMIQTTLAGAVLASLSVMAQAETVTFSGWGGALQDAERKAYLEPAASALGIEIREDNMSGLSAVRAQVMSGKPKWDIVELGSSECAQAEEEGLSEPLDYSVIDKANVDLAVVSKNWVGSHAYATVVAWAKDTGHPVAHNWQQFFDPQVKGARALYRQPWLTMEAALLGDGVAPKDLYPLDVDRAFKVLERIKPQVANWWSAGADSAQLLRSREVDFLAIWNGRVADVKSHDVQVDYSFDGAILSHDCLIVPKGAANKALAMKVIGQILTPESQARLATLIPYAPVNSQAYATGIISAEQARRLPTSPENVDKVVMIDPHWWVKNQTALQQRFDLFITQ
ncbi:ABC transporter substrate-binding protein [Pseudomonas panipatensis]|uniref:Putative spermidine/putrescine transport system substrate-binding protein n=1 Tax=Pseudomonas panipatensis TaxID=428992 RepID=A0A1G8L962_9PSED|nr:ABC transporter substrate-binding protein [Pseudomonas panipatensis]SDI51770.1 putative spermidine/putrescine transport system substrate-binding protein [Pseudomonas panipatensis]SMP75479.1 putative spermidine/putrescine transport system substrate-binding protein [Pseudomonas panipatensis]